MHSLIVTDIRMPGEDGFAVMRAARALAPHTAVILLTAFASVPDAVAAMKDGACDYLVKPVSFEQLEQAARTDPGAGPPARSGDERSGGHAPNWLRALDRARQAAASDADVLIEAESGTGKELVARLIHRLSPRRDRPFVAVNCAAFPETLLESELFGHAKGAFTGASSCKPGKFELAHGGTLLLDEVGEMPLGLQPKLLRALQEREFDRLGDTRPMRVDLRVIATTNRPWPQMVREGKFPRRPLLPAECHSAEPAAVARAGRRRSANWLSIFRPALRAARQVAAPDAGIPGAWKRTPGPATCGSWPTACAAWLPWLRRSRDWCRRARRVGLDPAPPVATDLSCIRPGVSLGDMERKLVEITLEATGGNRSRAAELLGVSLRTVRNKVRSYGAPQLE